MTDHIHDFTYNLETARSYYMPCAYPGCEIRCDWAPNHHDYVMMKSPDGKEAKVDEAIIPLIRLLWDNGVVTFASCQGGCYDSSDMYGGGSQGYIGYRAVDDELVHTLLDGKINNPVWEQPWTKTDKIVRWSPSYTCGAYETEKSYAQYRPTTLDSQKTAE